MLWPWLLIIFALIIVSVIFLRENLVGDRQLDPTPTEAVARGLQETVQATPDSGAVSPPSPLPTPTLAYSQAEPLRVAEIELPNSSTAGVDISSLDGRFSTAPGAINNGRGRPGRDRYVYYLQGVVETSQTYSDAWSISLLHGNAEGPSHRYTLIARGPWIDEDTKPMAGDEIAIIAWPVPEDQTQGDIVLDPLVMLDSEAHPLWMHNGDFQTWVPPDGQIWVYSVYGEGGTDGLGIEPPAGNYQGTRWRCGAAGIWRILTLL